MSQKQDELILPLWVEKSFQAVRPKLEEAVSAELKKHRQDAYEYFCQTGLPSAKLEDWKYTNIAYLAQESFEQVAQTSDDDVAAKLAPYVFADTIRLVFVDGYFNETLSDNSKVQGLEVRTFAQAFKEQVLQENVLGCFGVVSAATDNSLVALNSACMTDGAIVTVNERVRAAKPIHLVFLATEQNKATARYGRVAVNLQRESSCCVIESYIGSDGQNSGLNSSVTEFLVEEGASLFHYKLGLDDARTTHLASSFICQKQDSQVSSVVVVAGGALVRNEIYAVIDGENCETSLNGLSILSGAQHVDNFTVVEHAKAHSHSNQKFKGVYGEKSRGVFTGTIVVRPDAQKTNAYQSSSSILLSDDAHVDSRPQLKIWADDVKCSHGGTVGQLDEESLFYLQSRGIPFAKAKQMLVYAFADEIVNLISFDPLRNLVRKLLDERV